MGLVDGIRGLMRPAITTYTLYLLTVVFIWVRSLYEKTGVVMTAEEAHALTLQAVQTIIYLAVTTVVWWFGVRPAQPPRAVGR
jgi:ascorbate-specific PTS system EIIC-type component UlaA